MGQQKTAKCRWQRDDDGNYNTDCGQTFVLIDGTLAENKMRYCCYCGRPIHAKAKGEQ